MNHPNFSKLIHTLGVNRDTHLDSISDVLQIKRSDLNVFLDQLIGLGLPIEEVSENKIRLIQKVDYIRNDLIKKSLTTLTNKYLTVLPPFLSIDSTNQYLKTTKSQFNKTWRLCVTEHQTTGRGRQGKHWVSPISANIYMSLHIRLNILLTQIGGVSLMVGISVVEALEELGGSDLNIKWPNDIYWNANKLAGILIETTKLQDSCVELIIGIGVNVNMSEFDGQQIDQPWANLYSVIECTTSKNVLIAKITNRLIENIIDYERKGLIGMASRWEKLDYLYNKQITVHNLNNLQYSGTAVGINARGELLLKNKANEIVNIHAGDVSVRKVNHETIT